VAIFANGTYFVDTPRISFRTWIGFRVPCASAAPKNAASPVDVYGVSVCRRDVFFIGELHAVCIIFSLTEVALLFGNHTYTLRQLIVPKIELQRDPSFV
jgi:hypothetical protein